MNSIQNKLAEWRSKRFFPFDQPRGVLVAILGILLVFASVHTPSAPTLSATDSSMPTDPSPCRSTEGKEKATAFPAALSQLDGWRGVRLVRSYRGSYSYCSFEFPSRFGLRNDDEKKLILGLTRDRHRFIVRDIDGCMVSFDAAYNQLFRLATEFQDSSAARWFVMPKGDYDLNLDGEWAETYIFTYQPKVLMKFNDLRRILPIEEEADLAEKVCSAARSDAFLDGAGIEPVIRSLRQKGMDSLAQKLERECGLK